MCCRANGLWRRKTGRWASSSWLGFLRRPRGVPQIEVTFDIDANGNSECDGQGQRDRQGHAHHHYFELRFEQGRSRTNGPRMPKRTRPRTRKSARRLRRANSLDGLVYNIEKMAERISGEKAAGRGQDRGRVDAGREPERETLEGHAERSLELRTAHDKLTQASHKLAEGALHKANAAAQEAQPTVQPDGEPAAGGKEGRRRDRRGVCGRGGEEVRLGRPVNSKGGRAGLCRLLAFACKGRSSDFLEETGWPLSGT